MHIFHKFFQITLKLTLLFILNSGYSVSALESVNQSIKAVTIPIDETDSSQLEVDRFFAKADYQVQFRDGYALDSDFAVYVAKGVALFVDLKALNLPDDQLRSLVLHPDSFLGGAVSSTDPTGSNPVLINAAQVSQVTGNGRDYREWCAFTNQMGGVAVAGTIKVSLNNGETMTLGAEVGTTMESFENVSEATKSGGGLVISWPNKYCRGVKIAEGKCKASICGMTLGDMIDLAGQAGLTIPTAILAGGVDMVAGWLGQEGYAVTGRCGEVEFVWLIPLGCQCIYAGG